VADGSLFGRLAGPRIVDLFAGGGGASLGLRWATGVEPIVAINHNPQAIEMHAANHPGTEHYLASVFDVAPLTASRGRAVDLLWASPDCTEHSRAKGGKPRSKGTRALAWVVVDWAREVHPRIIAVENVPEFAEWGPLDAEDKPIKDRRGEDFRAWVAGLEAQGYRVEWRVLCAADYGAPTTRRRLFIVARRDGLPIRWPEPTHGKGRLPWLPAAGCIDWSIPCRSIFDRKKPLAEKTQARIAEGVRRYVLTTGDPYLLTLTHGGRLVPLDRPMPTVTGAHRGEMALVAAVLAKAHSNGFDRPGSGVWSAGAPLPTQTQTEQFAAIAATLIETGNGERAGQRPRCADVHVPFGTVTSTGSQGAVVAAYLARHFTGVYGRKIDQPMPTVTGVDHHALVKATLHVDTRNQLVERHVTTQLGDTPDRAHLCAAFLMRYFGSGGQWSDPRMPMPTVTSREGLAIVTVAIDGAEYVLTDIGMRMLMPRELARAQGFPDDYILTGNKGQQIERIGNSVVPQLSRAIATANLEIT